MVARLVPGLGQASLDFTVNVLVSGYVDQYPVQHELREQIFARFQKKGEADPVAATGDPSPLRGGSTTLRSAIRDLRSTRIALDHPALAAPSRMGIDTERIHPVTGRHG